MLVPGRDCVSGRVAGRRLIDWGVEREGGAGLWGSRRPRMRALPGVTRIQHRGACFGGGDATAAAKLALSLRRAAANVAGDRIGSDTMQNVGNG